MSAGKLNITIEQGTDFNRTFKITDRTTGEAVDLTGESFAGMIRKKASDVSPLASFTCSLLDQTEDETKGTFQVSLSATTSSAITIVPEKGDKSARPIMKCIYDIERTKADGTKERILEGILLISPEVTK